MDRAKKSARDRELYLLRRVEPTLCRAPFFHHRDGFLAWPADCQSEGPVFATSLAGRQCLHEPKHARVFLIRKLPAAKFPMAPRPHRHHLPSATPRHPFAGRHFLLHVSFSFLHPRYLSRRPASDQITTRFRSGGFLFSSAGRRTNRAGR